MTWQKLQHSSHETFIWPQFISFICFCGGLRAHKQLAIDAAPPTALNDPAIVYISTFRKSRLADHNTGRGCQSGTCYHWT